jgi:small subunit ribosomal protein S21
MGGIITGVCLIRKTTKRKYFPIKPTRDLCEIKIYDNNLDRALRMLRKQTQLSGIFKYLKIRRWHMTTKSRRKAKRRKSLARARRENKLMR